MASNEVVLWTGAGQIGMAIARRVGYGKKILVGDKSIDNAEAIAKIMNEAGFDVEPHEMDLSDRESILGMIARAKELGQITALINAAGVSPVCVKLGFSIGAAVLFTHGKEKFHVWQRRASSSF